MLDRVLVRIWMLVEQLARHQHETRRAEPALEGGALDERLLNRVERLPGFNRGNLRALRHGGEVEAAGDCGAVDEHRAAAAKALTAALARAVQAERVADHFDQRLVRRDLRRDRLAVQLEADLSSHRGSRSRVQTASGF